MLEQQVVLPPEPFLLPWASKFYSILIPGIQEVKTPAADGFNEFPFQLNDLCCGQEQSLMARAVR